MQEMALHLIDVKILRKNNGIITECSSELVPGDIIYINDDMRVPCDCVLLEGSVLSDESMLTGESVPVVKSALDSNEKLNEKTD
jgi:P-type E1-E2 ATPase